MLDAAALADSRTVAYDFCQGTCTARWPLLSPIEHHGDYREEFLLDRFAGREVMFLLTPPGWQTDARLATTLVEAQPEPGRSSRSDCGEERAEAIDFLSAFLSEQLQTQGEDRFIDPRNGSEVADTHYSAVLDTTEAGRRKPAAGLIDAFSRAVAAGELEKALANGTAIYRLDELEALRTPAGATYLERLMEIYEGQFEALAPPRQSDADE